MGTALAWHLSRAQHDVRLWARSAERAAEIQFTRENRRHLAGIPLPARILVTADAGEAAQEAELLIAAIPSAFLRETLVSCSVMLPAGIPVLSVVKGIENGTFARPSEIIRATLGERAVTVLSGPSHAEELAMGLPASLVVAGEDPALCLHLREVLNHGMFRVYSNSDLLGVELAGALKNILGIAAGICDGLGFGDNAKAALLTRGLVEIARFGVHRGARLSTFSGLAGVGDVITTCFSPHGRNRAVGFKIGQGAALSDVVANMADVAEGVPTTRSVHEQARSLGVSMPITAEVYQILFEQKPPLAAVTDLMLREPKDESL
jgi:glycerol-3-phosphate dehydrogenase (NAD(P)+)